MKVFDMHCDTLSVLLWDKMKGREYSLRRNSHHLDLEKMRRGNYLLQCFAIFVDLEHSSDPFLDALKMADLFYEEMEKNKDIISPVLKYEDIEQNRKEGKMSAMLTGEEGEICAGSIEVLRDFYRRGLRMMTLTWNHENRLAYPNQIVYDENGLTLKAETENGLKEKGFEFIAEMEKLHMAVDVSHLSDAGFWDVYNHTTKPFAASHSNARAVCCHVRNLTDEMLRAMGERGCIAGLNYCGSFLDGKGVEQRSWPSRIEDMVRNVKHITNVGGMEIMALGSDFDGIGGELEMESAACLPRLYAALCREGFHESDADRIFSGNAMRFFKEVL